MSSTDTYNSGEKSRQKSFDEFAEETGQSIGISASTSDEETSAQKTKKDQRPVVNDDSENYLFQYLSKGLFDPGFSPQLPNPEEDVAVRYHRVSSDGQGKSIPDQKEDTARIVETCDLEDRFEPVVDHAESGGDFERPGFKRVLELAKRGKISHIVVRKFDRIARNAVQGVLLVKQLRERCGVTIITNHLGEVGVEGDKLLMTMIYAFRAEQENRDQAEASQGVKIDQFKNGDYSQFYQNVPFGYSWSDDGQSPVVDEEKVETVKQVFEVFNRKGTSAPYKKTLETVENLPEEMSTLDVKDILTDSIYLGVPHASTENMGYHLNDRVFFYDPNLRIVPNEVFAEAQEKIDEMRTGSESNETGPVIDFFERHRPTDLMEIVDTFVAYCRDCDNKMGRNGTKESHGETVQVYRCSDCGTQRRIPTLKEKHELRTKRKESKIQFN